MKVSVILICYNQEKFIRQAVQSIVSQATTFDFEIIVADDCSTDATFEIIKEELKPFKGQVKFLERDRNLGIGHNYKRAFTACSGEYIALLEGDDYWIDPLRLSKHVALLDNEAFVSMSWNDYYIINEKGRIKYFGGHELHGVTYFTVHEQIASNRIGNLSACVYRRSYIEALPESVYDLHGLDWIFGIAMAEKGYIARINPILSAYRFHPKGVWSADKASMRKRLYEWAIAYKSFMNGRFTADFDRLIKNLRYYGLLSFKINDFVPPIVSRAYELVLPKFVRDIFSKLLSKLIK